MEGYTYIDESKISCHLFCKICKKPWINPVSIANLCEEIFCKRCIQLNFQEHENHCSTCQGKTFTNDDLYPANLALRKILDELPVQCSLCQEKDIQRIQFEKHSKNDCPKRTISCPGKDVMCQWTGHADQLSDHRNSCPYEQIRDNLVDLLDKIKRLDEIRKRCQELQNRLEKINTEYRDINEKLQRNELENENFDKELKRIESQGQIFNDQSIEQINQLNKQINELKEQINQLNEQISQLKPLETENPRLNEELKQISNTIKKLKDENELLTKENNRLEDCEFENEKLKEEINELNHWKTDYQSIESQLQECQIQKEQLEKYSEILLQELEDKSNFFMSIQTQNDQFRQYVSQMTIQIHELQKENETLRVDHENLKFSMDDYQEIYRQWETQYIEINHLQEENKNLNERMADYKLELERRDIELKQLQTKPLSQPQDLSIDYYYENKKLKQFICQHENNSIINLTGCQLNDNDMNIVIDTGLTYKQCYSMLLWNNSLTVDSTLKLFDTLSWNKTLTQLIIVNNSLSDSSMKCLCQSLSYHNQTLKELILRLDEINDQGLIYFSDIFKSNKTLTTIGLQENRISDRSIEYFSNILVSYQNSVENICLYSNELITDLSVPWFIAIIQKKFALKSLLISNCQLSDQGKDQIKQSIKSNIQLDLQL